MREALKNQNLIDDLCETYLENHYRNNSGKDEDLDGFECNYCGVVIPQEKGKNAEYYWTNFPHEENCLIKRVIDALKNSL